MGYLVDSVSWELVNEKSSLFSNEQCNLRLGHSIDGFNPFSNLSTKYSVGLVILVMYNLSTWLYMKLENILLTLLIPSFKQPGYDMDVYLKLFIENLKTLWNDGIDVNNSECLS